MFFIERLCQRAIYIKAGRLARRRPGRRASASATREELLDEFASHQRHQRVAEKQRHGDEPDSRGSSRRRHRLQRKSSACSTTPSRNGPAILP